MILLVVNCEAEVRSKIAGGTVSWFATGQSRPVENTWSTLPLSLGQVADRISLNDIKKQFASVTGRINAFAVEGISAPNDGRAFLVGGHKMIDTARFKPYADSIVGVMNEFKGTFLARGGTVTPIVGTFCPDRPVIVQFSEAIDAAKFYVSSLYAPLLDLRFKTTIPRLVLLARDGAIPAAATEMFAAYVPPSPYPLSHD